MSFKCPECKERTRVNKTRGALRERVCPGCNNKFVTNEVRIGARTLDQYDKARRCSSLSDAEREQKNESNRMWYARNSEARIDKIRQSRKQKAVKK